MTEVSICHAKSASHLSRVLQSNHVAARSNAASTKIMKSYLTQTHYPKAALSTNPTYSIRSLILLMLKQSENKTPQPNLLMLTTPL
jgi:hypothetical protein